MDIVEWLDEWADRCKVLMFADVEKGLRRAADEIRRLRKAAEKQKREQSP